MYKSILLYIGKSPTWQSGLRTAAAMAHHISNLRASL